MDAHDMGDELRILVVTPAFLPAIGGAEIGIHEIYSRLGCRHQVTILTKASDRSERVSSFDQDNYTVVSYADYLNLGSIRGKMLLHGVVPPFSIGALCGASREIRRLRPDVVNVHYAAYTGLAAAWAQKVLEVPTVLSLVGRDSVPGPLVPDLWPWYAHLIAKQVSHTIFISEFCRSHHGEGTLRSSVIPYGADTTRIAPRPADESLRERLGIVPGLRVLFAMQRLSALKHVEVAIQSVRHLLDQGIDDFVLLVGGDGPDADKLRQLVATLNLREHVKLVGFVPEEHVGCYFALADVFVFPSVFETFGVVLAQAMAASLPVVATRNSAIPEVVQDGLTGLLSPPLDAEAMAGSIALLLANKELRNRMGREGRKIAERLYDWGQIALQYEDVLRSVVARHQAGDKRG
jgi:glycosyltransferase involved in cell wall biosynthesis